MAERPAPGVPVGVVRVCPPLEVVPVTEGVGEEVPVTGDGEAIGEPVDVADGVPVAADVPVALGVPVAEGVPAGGSARFWAIA